MSVAKKPHTMINSNCKAQAAYNFNIANKEKVGHLLSLAFTTSGKELVADVPLSDPENPDNEVKVVGVIEGLKWEGGNTDPINIAGRLSPKNRGLLLEALSATGGGVDLEAEWVLYEYDHKEKKYFQKFHTDKKKIKMVLTEDTKVHIADDPDTIVQQPVNYTFEMSWTGKSEAGVQTLDVGHSADAKCVKQFGVHMDA